MVSASYSHVATKILLYLFTTTLWISLLWFADRLWKEFGERKSRTEYGCSAPRKLPTAGSFLGITKLRESAARIKEGFYLELSKSRFLSVGSYTYASSALGKTVIDTSDPENVQAMLATNFKDWALGEDRTSAFSPLLGNGIFAADGHHWRSSRTALRPSFTSEYLTRLELFEHRFQSMLRVINHQKGALDLSEMFACFTLDCTTEIFFGKSYDTLETRYQCDLQSASSGSRAADAPANLFTEAFNRCQRAMADNLVLGKFGPFLMGAKRRKQFDKDCDTVHSFVGEAVNHALTGLRKRDDKGTTRSTFLHSLLAADQNPSDVRSALVNILVAGRDTTASLLANLWFVLARNPRIYKRICTEIHEVLGGDSTVVPTLEDLNRMPYLQACIHESLRLHPPVPLNSRTAVRDTILPTGGGESGREPLFIPRGTRVGYNIYAMHRRKDIWGEQADTFDPDRWIKEDGSKLQPGWEYLPFSGGPRICIGQKLALTQARFVTCRLAQHFQQLQAEADNAMPSTMRTKSELNYNKGAQYESAAETSAPAPASSWQWRESLTLTCTSATGTHVTLLER